jgi:SecD/SecF fusion protein
MPSLFAANQYLNLIKNNDITNVIPNRLIYDNPLGDNLNTSNGSYNFANNVTFKIDRTNDNDFINLHVFYGLIISIVCALLLIGLVVSLLYRIPGLLGFLACLGASGLAMMILLATGSALSTNLVLGMVIAFAGLMLVVFNFGERVKGWTRYNEKYDLAIRKSFRSTIWQSVLIIVVLITFGVAFTYFGLPQVALLGNVLMLSGILAIPFVAILWPISC